MSTVAIAVPAVASHETVPARQSAVSWPAIFAGAVAAAALSLILLALGSGLGLSSISPWAYAGASAKAVGIGAIAWLLLMAAAASGLGGYLTGRLRARWTDVDDDESYFRDTANGLLAWAVATIGSAALLASAASSMVGATVTASAAAATVASSASAAAGTSATDSEYFVDMLLRGSRPQEPGTDSQAVRAETGRVLARSLVQGELTAGDRSYLATVIEKRTGLSSADASKRVDDVAAAARSAADAARKAAAVTALWVFVSLLVGAFAAAYFAMVGGRRRLA
ncbi:MAG: hypothetical protein ABI585_01665 [Betaproteobacteria bacterium]